MDSKCTFGLTLLAYAAAAGQGLVFSMLIDSGRVKLDAKDLQEATVLSRAASSGNNTIVSLTLDTGLFDVDSADLEGCTAWFYAMVYAHHKSVELLEAARKRKRGAADIDQACITPS